MADDKKAKKDASPEAKADKKPGAPVPDAAPPADGEAPAEEQAPRFTKKKILIFALLPLLIMAGGVGTAWQMGYLDKVLGRKLNCENVQEDDKDYAACAEQLAASSNSAPPGLFMAIPDMIVNLNSTAKQPRFLKVALKVELEDKAAEKAFETVMPRVIDQFQAYMRELRLEDLRGSSGMYRMKIELLSRVRAAAPDIKVRDVLFQEILVQ